MHARSFFKQAPDTSIFTDSVTFLDNVGPRIGLISASVSGKKAYLQRLWLLRTHSRLIFSRCEARRPCRHCCISAHTV